MFFHSVVHICFVSLRVGEAPEGKCQLTPKLYQKEQGKQISGSDVLSSFTSLASKWGSHYCLFVYYQKKKKKYTEDMKYCGLHKIFTWVRSVDQNKQVMQTTQV